ncbi:prepilin-type N-terminal cleavage/methylation domain-containing protein [Methylosinus sp. H3A]|uniref:PulJ/GspJ family protein n=1 Tax=Methylosinus sp. H3A TaxID=2785786 RepID=UPI0018C1FEEC|nr:prepilin-type N-terminal cleavage/methylation domain-containing protein [Methylosinus sp. H3A]MBG0808328.1 prepilin-type N-terminal cleavage/methylation domain-containing protein [Methylosinus sp. H3A]
MKLPRRARGFTLIEALLSIALMSLIVGTIAGGFRLGKRVWETGRDYEGVQEVEEAAGALEAILSRAFPILLDKRDGAPTVAIEGRPDRIRLVTTSDGGADWGGPALTEIAASGDDLDVRSGVLRPEAWSRGAGGPTRSATALRGLAAFELAYFGAPEPNAAPVWTKNWVERMTAPKLVSVRLTAKRNGKLIDSSFVVRIRQNPL